MVDWPKLGIQFKNEASGHVIFLIIMERYRLVRVGDIVVEIYQILTFIFLIIGIKCPFELFCFIIMEKCDDVITQLRTYV